MGTNNVLSGVEDDDSSHPTRIGANWSGTRDAGKWVFMTSGVDVTYTYPAPGTTLDHGCLWLFRDYNSVSGRRDGPWYMGGTHCSWRYNDNHNLCEIPAAA